MGHPNDNYDYGTGFVAGGVADTLEQRFGVYPRFGYAGGCVNMVLDLESGHRVNITDAQMPYLTHIKRRSVAEGFSVGVYTSDGFDNGEPTVMLTRYVDVAGLGDLVADAISALRTAQSI